MSNITANFIAPTEGQEFMRGEIIGVIIEYTGLISYLDYSQTETWIEKGKVNANVFGVGIHELKTAYKTNEGVSLRINGRSLGIKYNSFDDIIIDEGGEYSVPPDLLKSLIHQEALVDSKQQVFIADSYRYEAHRDYDWYSRQSPLVSPEIGWRGLANHPEHHFAIGGYVVTGESVQQGDQVPANYLTVARANSFLSIDTTDTNGDGDLTATELVANNPRQGWYDRPDWEFTAQLVLSASYGLGQIMYETAINRGFDTREDNGQPARDIYDLFKPEVSVDLSAKHLKSCYDKNNQVWRDALICYNGSVEYAESVLVTWASNVYQLIIEE